MRAELVKLKDSMKSDRLLTTVRKCARYPFKKLAERAITTWVHTRLRWSTPAEIFSRIHEQNLWRDSESASGAGSTLRYTENLRKHLPALFQSLSVKSVYDAPCGDYNWMRKVVAETDILYFGADIVPALVENNAKYRQADRVRFGVADITKDKFPPADLWICRDCLFHLSHKDIYRALKNFVSSDVPYVLTTTHLNRAGFSNLDIPTGDFRLLDLFSPPFNLPKAVKFRISDWVDDHPPREMCVWTKDQVSQALPKMRASLRL